MSTEICVSSSAADLEPRVLASRCSSWMRKSRRLPISPPASIRRSISFKCESNRVTSSATSMRMAKAVASVRARSWAASALTVAWPLVWLSASASFQRSTKRCRCWATSCGTSGTACAVSWASSRLRSLSMSARRAPSRWRALPSSLATFSARGKTTLLQSCGVDCSWAARRNTSATDSGLAVGNQARTLSCSELSRCSKAGAGSPNPAALCSMKARTSTLPRLSLPASNWRKAGSKARNSSGRRNVMSRKRLLTQRISSPKRAVLAGFDSVLESGAGAFCWALAYPVML